MIEKIKTPTDDERLTNLVSDYYAATGKGCLPALADLALGKSQKRAKEISEIMGITDKDVMQLFMAVNAMSLLGSKEETLKKAQEGFIKGMHGEQTTGNPVKDQKILKVAAFVKTAIDKRWELKDKQPQTGNHQ